MPSRRVAVIGAGAAGLVAARELLREGHSPVVFERAAGVGGTWLYNGEASAEPLGAGGVHGSLYASLRTNLPRECMGFLDFPFVADEDSVDPRRFPGHQEVLRYLQAFARWFDLHGLIRLEAEVVSVRRSGDASWSVSYCRRKLAGADAGGELQEEEEQSEVFDAVVVCNGHFAEPRLAEIAGKLDDEEAGVVAVDDNRVGPLYKHVFPPRLAPRISFIGLPFKAIPFLVFQLQSSWVAGVLSGRIELPPPKEMMQDVAAFYTDMEACGRPKRFTHDLGASLFEYEDWLVERCGLERIEEWRKAIYVAARGRQGLFFHSGPMAPLIINNDEVQGETFAPGQIFVFGGFALRANSLGHLEQIESYAPGH
ncbi:flavin-containing monooxygenase FMO GS-OX-like 4, partial [Triticum dicoccoides]|uniref:flavin-containing monooxygenase FMO GS-OX-like 4 n=1 Tax=Triticum dicoccoides TaxID=85692 RepID=UPI00188F88AE